MGRKSQSLVIVLTVVMVLGAFTAPAVASPFADVTEDDEDEGMFDFLPSLESVLGGLEGLLNRASHSVTSLFDDDDTGAEDWGEESKDVFNEHNEEVRDWINPRANASEGFNSFRIVFDDGEDEYDIYILAGVVNGTYTTPLAVNGTVIDDEFTADHTIVVSGPAAKNMPDEVEFFLEEFVLEDQNVTDRYISRMATQYFGHVELSFDWESED